MLCYSFFVNLGSTASPQQAINHVVTSDIPDNFGVGKDKGAYSNVTFSVSTVMYASSSVGSAVNSTLVSSGGENVTGKYT